MQGYCKVVVYENSRLAIQAAPKYYINKCSDQLV